MLLILVFLSGCGVTNYTQNQPTTSKPTLEHQIIAIVDGHPITQNQIQENLGERAGRQALSDLILDYQLERIISEKNIHISQSDLDLEQQKFLDLIKVEDSLNANLEYMDQVRKIRGLGPTRYHELLRRNAILRKLVNPEPPTKTEFQHAVQVAFGEQFQIRLIVNTNRALVESAYQRVLRAQPESARWVFAQEAFDLSSHPSSTRGGFIPNFSILDTNYPSVLCSAVQATELGKVTPILSTDSGFAFVLVESVVTSREISEEQRVQIKDQLEVRNQRLAMEQLASTLISQSEITILDKALSWSWKNIP
ncbi:MAG: hypothetical protein P1U42_02005 [Phycisphaerales bacterium]|nr:hypothetical protein [Phycisphaerales bacterium]